MRNLFFFFGSTALLFFRTIHYVTIFQDTDAAWNAAFLFKELPRLLD